MGQDGNLYLQDKGIYFFFQSEKGKGISSLITAFFCPVLISVVPFVVPEILPAASSIGCWKGKRACFSCSRVGGTGARANWLKGRLWKFKHPFPTQALASLKCQQGKEEEILDRLPELARKLVEK